MRLNRQWQPDAKQHKEQQLLVKSRLKILSRERNIVLMRECRVCGCERSTIWAKFIENESYFFRRRERTFSAFVCWPCMTKRFLEFESNTLALTWWGMIGFFLGPIYLTANLIEYLWKSTRLAQSKFAGNAPSGSA